MTVLLDPSFLIVRRGRDWLERYACGLGGKIVVADRLRAVQGLDEQESALKPWRARGLYQYARPLCLPNLDGLSSVRSGPPEDLVSLRLAEAGNPVLSDLWEGLRRGLPLALRRTPTLDALVMAGVELRTVGRDAHPEACGRLLDKLEANPAEALLRRVRFVASSCTTSKADRPIVFVADAGPSGFR